MTNETQKLQAPRRSVKLKAETLRALEVQDPNAPKAYTDACTYTCTCTNPCPSHVVGCTTTCPQ